MNKRATLPQIFEIEPYEAVGPIRFGMTDGEVRAVLGDPTHEGRNRRGEIDQSWGHLSIRYGIDRGRVVEIALIPPAIVTYNGRDLFACPDPIRVLEADDPAPMEYVGFVVFLGLGLTLTGVHDHDDSQKALTAFGRGRWDGLLPKLRPLGRT